MSFGRLASLSERLGQRRSMELPGNFETPRQEHGDDFVLVGGSHHDSGSSQGHAASQMDPALAKSPEPVALHLTVPSEADADSFREKGVHLDLDINDDTLLPAWKGPAPASDVASNDQDLDLSAATDCTDYSGLGTRALDNKDLRRALEQANQQHEWAMEAVIRGWEAEKADLLTKLEKTTEARDTLEVELKHRESNFAGLLDSMLDQKLDQMLQLLQESGIPPQTPPSSRASPNSSSPSQQPTVKKAQKVVNDLGSIMEAMKMQHAAVEEQVVGLQSAILHLLPEDLGEEERQRIASSIDAQRIVAPRKSNPVRACLRSAGGAFNSSKAFAREKGPRALQAGRAVATQTVSAPIRLARGAAKGVSCYCQGRGLRYEHVTAVAGILAGILASALLVRSIAKKEPRSSEKKVELAVDHASRPQSFEVTKEEAGETQQKVEEGVGQCMHIIFSGNGIYKRTTYDSSPSLMFAWPKIVLDYK